MDKFKTLNKKTIIAIVAICILAIVAIVGVVAFLKDDGSATAIDEIAKQESESENTNVSENAEQSPSATDNNSNAQENTSSENTANNSVMPSDSANVATNTANQTSTSTVSNTPATGTTTSTTNTNVPNQEYVTSRVEEVERQVSEDLAVSWQNLDVAGKFTNVNIEDLGITAEKKVYIKSNKEVIPQEIVDQNGETVVAGDEITYVIEVTNISREAKKGIRISDVVPAQTELKNINNGGVETIVNNQTKIFWTIDFENGEEKKLVSFTVIVKDDATGTIKNIATANGDKTNETHNTIIKTTKKSSVSKCVAEKEIAQKGETKVVHEGDTVSYVITVSNTGDTDEKISLSDEIPEGLSLVASTVRVNKEDVNITSDNNQIIVNEYTLGKGETLEITFDVTVNKLDEDDMIEESNGNKVYKKIIDANVVVVNDKETPDSDGEKEVLKPYIETSKVSEIADCTITPKALTGSTVHEGDTIKYTITVSNAKGSEAGIINLSDSIPTGLNISGNVTANLADAQAKLQVVGNTITLTDYKLQAGATLEITFNTVVANLGTTINDNGETVKITSARIEANKVIVNGDPTEDPDGPKDVKKPNIEISKTSTVVNKDYVRVGESFDYVITATNKGTEKGNAVITDIIPTQFTIDSSNIKVDGQEADASVVVNGNTVKWTVADLGANASKELRIRVTVKDITGVKEKTTNTATIDNGNPPSSTDVTIGKSDIVTAKTSQVVTCSDYGMTGSNIDVVHENDEIQYTIEVENNGVVSDKINVRDQLTSQVEFVEGSLTAKVGTQDIIGVNVENGVITLTDYELAANSKLVITFTVKVKTLGTDANGNKITKAIFEANTVYVNDEPTEDPDGPGEIKKPDLNITKTSSIAEGKYAEIGKQFSYFIVVANNGDEKGSAVVEDNVPSNLRIDSCSDALTGDTITVEGNKVTWNVNNLSAKTSRRIEIKVTPISITGNEEKITNIANIKDGPDSSTDITVAKPIILTTKVSKVVKCNDYAMIDGEGVDKVKTVHEGDEIEYTITITNSGKVAGIVNMSDPLPTGMTYKANSLNSEAIVAGVVVASNNKSISLNNYSLAAETTLTITFKVTIDNLGTTLVDGKEVPVTSASLIANKVTVNGVDEEDPNPPTDVKKANITATKETPAADEEYISENRTVEYTITVTNTGDEKGNAVVTDTLDDRLEYKQSTLVNKYEKDTIFYDSVSKTVTWNVVDLPAGESRTATITVWVGEIAQGVSETIPNAVYVDGKHTDDETITVGKPSIKTDKSSEILECAKGQKDGTKVHEGDVIKYTIRVKNEGTLPKAINITDSIKSGLTYVEGTLSVNRENTGATIVNGALTISNYELPAGQEMIITFNVRVNELTEADYSKDKDGNMIYSKKIDANVAIVDGQTPSDNKEYEVVKPMINVKKEVSKQLVSINEEFYYNIKVTNVGTDVGNTVITDTIPNELIYNGYVLPADIKDIVTYDEATRLLTWNVESLNVGESRELRINVKAPADVIENPTSVVNAVYKDNNKTPEDSVETEVAKPVINTTKSSEVTECKLNLNTEDTIGANAKTVHEGDVIKYTITITNSGKVAGIVNMSDPLPTGMTYKANSLKTNLQNVDVVISNDNKTISLNNYSLAAETTLTITFEVTIDNLGTTTVDGKEVPVTSASLTANKVTVNGVDEEDPNPPTDVKKPNIVIAKTSNANGRYLNVGEEFEYTITATNNGTEVGSAIVTDQLPNGVEYISYTNNGDVIDISNLPAIKWTVKDLGVGASRDLKIKVKAKDFTGTEQAVENTAAIDNGNPDAKTTDNVGKSQISANKTSKVVACGQYGMIDSEGTAKVTTVHEGDEIEYTITITNSGKVAGVVNMSDPLPTGMTYKANSLNSEAIVAGVVVASDNKSISLNNYSLAAGTTLTITFRATIDNLGTTMVDGKEVPVTSASLTANKVTVNGVDEEDPNPPTDVKKPNINTTKTSVISECAKDQTSGTTVHEGDKIRYTITVSNDGTEYKNINVSDTLKSGVSLIENTISVKDNGVDAQGISVSEDKRTISMNGYRLEAGHTLTITFEVSVDTLAENVTKATIEANQVIVDTKPTSDDKTYEVVKPNINVTKQVVNTEGTDINEKTVDVRSTLKYVLVGTNTGDEDSNVTITDDVDITKLTDVKVTGVIKSNKAETVTAVTYDNKTGKVSWSGLLEKNSGNQVVITIEAKTRNLNESELTYTVENTAKYIPEGSSEKSTNKVTNDVKIMIESDKTATVINDENDGKAEYGDVIEYTITAENKSESDGKVDIVDPLPNGVEYSETLDGKANPIVVKVNGTNVGTGSYDAETRTISYSGNVVAGAKLTLTFKVKVTSTELNEDIVNKATINGIEKTATVDVVKKLSISATAQVTKSMDLVLVLDYSGSMKGSRITALRNAATALVNKVFPDGVETDSTVTIITYSANAKKIGKYTSDSKSSALDAISRLRNPDGGTHIKSALDETNKLFDNNELTNDKQVVIFLTDGAPTVPSDNTGLIDISNQGYNNNKVDGEDSIVSAANQLKTNADMVYSIGLGTENLSTKNCAYVIKCDNINNCNNATHQAMNSVVPFTGVKERDVGGRYPWSSSTKEYYHYYSEKDLAMFVLKTIGKNRYIPVADGADTSGTTENLSKEFDAILKDSSTIKSNVSTSTSPAVLTVSETANVMGDVVLSMNETTYTYSVSELMGSAILPTGDVLKYTPGVGFTLTINNKDTFEKELHLAYTVDKK